MNAEGLTVERYNRLVAETGLGPLIASYLERGYQFLLQTAASESHTSAAEIKQNRIWLSAKDLDNPDTARFPEAARFLALILHELGHCEAYERGLSQGDEALAWRIAAEISPVPLPPEWPRLRSHALTSYKSRVEGDALDQEQADLMLKEARCPSCKSADIYGCSVLNSRSTDGLLSMPCLCRDCDAGYVRLYRIVGSKPVFECIVSWELPDD